MDTYTPRKYYSVAEADALVSRLLATQDIRYAYKVLGYSGGYYVYSWSYSGVRQTYWPD